jgi:hypothetical protein
VKKERTGKRKVIKERKDRKKEGKKAKLRWFQLA